LSRGARLALALALASQVSGALACSTRQSEGLPTGSSDRPGAAPPTDQPVSYVFDSLDDRPVSSDAMRGKPTVIVFITTGDITGQAQVDFLVAMAKNDKERVNYALVALHPRKEIVLVETYVDTLKVTFPVALADPSATTSASGPFGEIAAVPTVVVLDRDGRLRWKHTGLAKSDELRGHMHGL
jgi:hypothetical protein